MALKIRLRRMGRRNAPTYRIVVAESSMPRDGRIVTSIGHYNPRTEPATLAVDRAKALEWLGKGAMPTDTALALLKKAGVFRPEEEQAEDQGVVATAVAGAAERAKKVASGAKSIASKVADVVEDVAEKVADVVEDVAEKVADRVGDGVGGEKEVDASADASTASSADASLAEEPEAVADDEAAVAGETGEAEEAKV